VTVFPGAWINERATTPPLTVPEETMNMTTSHPEQDGESPSCTRDHIPPFHRFDIHNAGTGFASPSQLIGASASMSWSDNCSNDPILVLDDECHRASQRLNVNTSHKW